MSEQQNRLPSANLPAGHDTGAFKSALSRMVDPLAGHLTAALEARRITEIRRSTRREIENLPAGLQRDLAFSEGALVHDKRS